MIEIICNLCIQGISTEMDDDFDVGLDDANGEDKRTKDSVGAQRRPVANAFGDDEFNDDIDMDIRSNQGM